MRSLPQLLETGPFLTDGGLETSLVFRDGIALVDFAAFPLVDTDEGRAALRRYFAPYLDLAARVGAGIVLDTPTWRANLDWGARLGYDPARLASVNRRAVEFVTALASEQREVSAVVNGVVGPRGDGYLVGATMTAAEAASYHGLQARSFADAGAHMISAITMTYPAEAIGVARAAAAVNLPAVISFTVETDGRLPCGLPIGDAIDEVDQATGGAPAYYMLNCAHPTHFLDHLGAGTNGATRIKGVRANSSRLSHAELDAATELDRGDIPELARLYAQLRDDIDLRVVGGCCGTDHEHISAIASALGMSDGTRRVRPNTAAIEGEQADECVHDHRVHPGAGRPDRGAVPGRLGAGVHLVPDDPR